MVSRSSRLSLISPSLLYVFIFSTVQALQELTAPLIIFTTGSNAGPLNAGLFYTVYLYQSAFLDARMGYARGGLVRGISRIRRFLSSISYRRHYAPIPICAWARY